jgi:hydroxymethylpyrimidine/phosphomethylpyrimidine kinase
MGSEAEVGQRTNPIALTIAGSDSGGGAGIQADLRTFTACGCFGTSVITAVTAQNTLGVRAVHLVPAAIVSAQVEALAEDLPPDACKTGMLGSAELVVLVADKIRDLRWNRYVLDPVIHATAGDTLLAGDGVGLLRELLVPLAACVTPNLDEAEALTGVVVRDAEGMVRAGQLLVEMGAAAALIKGGHLESDILVDVLVTRDAVRRFTRSRIVTRATHGTGCTLSAAITAGLACGRPLEDTVTEALDYVQRAIRAAPGLGAGRGPLGAGS